MSSARPGRARRTRRSGRRARRDATQQRVFVVEVDDSFGAPLRNDRPNVYVGRTTKPLDTHIDALIAGTAGPTSIRGHVMRDRPDLYSNYGPAARQHAHRQLRRLVCQLTRRSYRVVGHARYQVYVIELDASARHPELDRPWVYVGVTSKTPEDRLHEHLAGARNRRGPVYSRVVRRYGVRLLPDLTADRTPVCARDARKHERTLAIELHERGFLVEGDGLPRQLRRTTR